MLVLSEMCNIYSGPIWALVKLIRARTVLCFPVTGAATVGFHGTKVSCLSTVFNAQIDVLHKY
jgi:hypothetical protein